MRFLPPVAQVRNLRGSVIHGDHRGETGLPNIKVFAEICRNVDPLMRLAVSIDD